MTPAFFRSMRSLVVLLVAAGCPGPDSVADIVDGGALAPADAGTTDAGSLTVLDGGVVDAGVKAFDAGVFVEVPKTITVSGQVVSRSEFTIVGATVVLVGKGATTTGADGTFTFNDVTPPYDLAVVISTGTKPAVSLYKNLTRERPRIFILNVSYSDEHEASSTLTLTGAAKPVGEDQLTAVVFDGPQGHLDQMSYRTSYNPMLATWQWSQGEVKTGTMFALQWKNDASGLPSSFDAFGKAANVTLANGNSFSKDIQMGPVDGDLTSGSVTPPRLVPLSAQSVSVLWPNSTETVLGERFDPASDFNFRTPNITGAKILVKTWAGDVEAFVVTHSKLASGARAVEIKMPENDERLSLPADKVSNVDLATQVFSWSTVKGAHYQVKFSTDSFVITIATDDPRVVMPNTAELGLGNLSSGSAVSWRVRASETQGGLDGYASRDRKLAFPYADEEPDHFSEAMSETRTFTTK